MVEVCAIVYEPNGNVICPIGFPFRIILSTIEGSAGKGLHQHDGRVVMYLLLTSPVPTIDYDPLSVNLNFAACETRQCVNVTIVDDFVDEPIESFSVTLDRTPGFDVRIRLDPVEGVVEIDDNDGKICVHTLTFKDALTILSIFPSLYYCWV